MTAENLQLPWGGTQTYIDILADEIFVAEKEGRKTAVEVKSFIGKLNLSEFEKRSGNYHLSFGNARKRTRAPAFSCRRITDLRQTVMFHKRCC
jgi:hypothetical protein